MEERSRSARPATERLAGAPISWGICEIPGWGRMLAAERVLSEMSRSACAGCGSDRALERHGYDGWFVLEQDTAITGAEPPVGSGPMLDVEESIGFLMNSAQTTQEVH